MEHPVGRMDPTKKIHPITIGVTISDTKNIITRIDSNQLKDIKDIDSIKITKKKKIHRFKKSKLQKSRFKTSITRGGDNSQILKGTIIIIEGVFEDATNETTTIGQGIVTLRIVRVAMIGIKISETSMKQQSKQKCQRLFQF